MSAIDDFMDTVSDQIDNANDLNPLIKFGLSIIFTLIGYYIVKYSIVRPWGRVVMSTDTAWDDKLHRPIANRAYFFLYVGAAQLTALWVSNQAEFNDSIAPYFSAIYILTCLLYTSPSPRDP